jgi:hypothetical protein
MSEHVETFWQNLKMTKMFSGYDPVPGEDPKWLAYWVLIG